MALGSGRKPDFTDEETEKNYTGSEEQETRENLLLTLPLTGYVTLASVMSCQSPKSLNIWK